MNQYPQRSVYPFSLQILIQTVIANFAQIRNC